MIYVDLFYYIYNINSKYYTIVNFTIVDSQQKQPIDERELKTTFKMSESGAEKLSKTKKLSGSSPSSKASRRKRRDSKQPEIESGVEMHEDTILMAPANSNRKLTGTIYFPFYSIL